MGRTRCSSESEAPAFLATTCEADEYRNLRLKSNRRHPASACYNPKDP
jgi:hypothetical protein